MLGRKVGPLWLAGGARCAQRPDCVVRSGAGGVWAPPPTLLADRVQHTG